MKKLSYIFILLLLMGCNAEDAPNCLKTTGNMMEKEVALEFFDKVVVFDRIDLFIEQGEQNVLIKAGENIIDDVSVEVVDGQLRVSGANYCNLFREYGTTSVHISVPNLTSIENGSVGAISSVGTLNFPSLTLVTLNQERDSDIYTSGQYILNLNAESLNISNDNIAKYFLSGNVTNLNVAFYNGDGRLEAGELIAQNVSVFHRGSNKMIVNPQQSISGEIRSTGDVVALNEPPVVEVEAFYTGRLIFQEE